MRTRRGFGVDSARIQRGSDASDMDSTRIRCGQGRDGTDKVARGCNIRTCAFFLGENIVDHPGPPGKKKKRTRPNNVRKLDVRATARRVFVLPSSGRLGADFAAGPRRVKAGGRRFPSIRALARYSPCLPPALVGVQSSRVTRMGNLPKCALASMPLVRLSATFAGQPA
eukprot:795841-Pyramimonas_sp.AAC.1